MTLVEKKFILIITFLIIVTVSYSQSYLGLTTKEANLREEPNKTSEVLDKLKSNSQLFVYSNEATDDYYNVIDIATDQEGWIHKSLVKLIKPLPKSAESLFTADEKINSSDCTVTVKNNTSLSVTLKLNSNYYYFDAQETKTLTMTPASYQYVASAPSVIPYFGDDTLLSGYSYSWTFYIETSYTGGVKYNYSTKRKRKN